MAVQYFGTMDTAEGQASAMMCVDDDLPNEFMVQWYGDGITRGGAVTAGSWSGDTLELVPRLLFRAGDKGGLYAPDVLSPDEIAWMTSTKATLVQRGNVLQGEWVGPDGKRGQMAFHPSSDLGYKITPTSCDSWQAFKTWAHDARVKQQAGWFRGHGCNSFVLRTTLHRAGRYRLDRYFANELVRFKMHAEALLNTRFNMKDGDDYSTVIALAQHHGLPTPMLDWTLSPYIAAFFAFSDALEGQRAQRKSTQIRVFALSEKFIANSSPPTVVLGWPQPFVASLSVGPLHNPRLYAQQGRFMVTNVVNVEAFIDVAGQSTGEQLLSAADVPVSFAAEALKDLAYMGLTAATMFPGLDGVGRMIRHEMAYAKTV